MLDIRDWLNVILPRGKGSLIVYSLYADESYEDTCGHVTVAGYLIASKPLALLTDAWATALGPLDYFHMKEGHHYKHPDVYERLLKLMTCDHLTAGFAASVVQAEYATVMDQKLKGQPMRYWFGGAYSFCVQAIAGLANKWLDENNPGERDVAYVFEAGHARQGEASMFLEKLNSDPAFSARKRQLRYFSHTFMDGKRREAGALHAADILAWNITDGRRRNSFSEAGRRLVESVPVLTIHYPESGIRDTLQAQLEFCNFYDSLRRATRLRAPADGHDSLR